MEFVLDDASNEVVQMLKAINVEEEAAIAWYWRVIGNNKEFFLIIGFLLLFSLFFYVALSRMTRYLRQIEKGINNIASDSEESIQLISELGPIETRLADIKQTLKKQQRETAEAEKKKNDLVVYLAHDLKTPLTSIVAYLTMLDSYKDMPEEERDRYTHIALEKSVRLGELINEFFDITKFNLQDIELEPIEIDLSFMLEQIADELYGVLQEKSLVCEVDVEENLEVFGDPDKLARVFDNLLRVLLIMAAIYMSGVIATFLYNRFMVVIAQGVLKKIRDDMFAHMQTLPIKYFDTHTHGDIMSYYTNDTDTLRQVIAQTFPQFVSSIVTIVTVFFNR